MSCCHFEGEQFSCRFSILGHFGLLSEFCPQMSKTSPDGANINYGVVVPFSACVLPCIVVAARLDFKLFADERVPWHTRARNRQVGCIVVFDCSSSTFIFCIEQVDKIMWP